MDKKALVTQYRPLVALACRCHNLRNCFRTRKKGQGNRIQAPCALLKKVSFHISGDNNTVIVEDFSVLDRVSFYISGSNNRIVIGAWSRLAGTEFCVENDGNTICLGQHTKLYGKAELAALEGTSITIGEDCLFSSDIHFRTSDSHSVLDLEGRRINAAADITLGDHVWISRGVTVMKGACVGAHSILGAGAIVTGKFPEPNCSIAGVPAKILKHGVDWSIHRVPVGELAPDFVPISEQQEETV